VPLDTDGAWTLYVAVWRHDGEFPYRTEARVREDIQELLGGQGPWSLIGGTDKESPHS
jgi:hypothetical protein